MLQPWPLQVVFDSVILDKPPPRILATLAGPFWDAVSRNLLSVMIAALVLVALAASAAMYLQNIAYTRLAQATVRKLRIRLFAHVLELPVALSRRMGAGELIERITTDTDDSQKLVEGASTLLFRSIPTFLGITAIMVWVDGALALVTIVLALVLVLATYYFGVKVKGAIRRKRVHESEVATLVEAATKTHKWLKVLGLNKGEIERMEEKSDASRRAAVEAGIWQGFYVSSTNVALAAGSAVLVLFGVSRIKAGQLSPGELLVFMSYLKSLYKPIREFTKYFIKISKALACVERIEQVMALTPCDMGVCESPQAEELPSFRRSIAFDKASYAFEAGSEVLRELSFEIPKGWKVALVGDSGSGKSTVLNLIPRFFDATRGSVRIDGRDIRSFTLESLRKRMAVVTQDLVLFSTTVRSNIALGRPEEEVSREEIVEAARAANAHDFIMKLPDGYETDLASGENRLSGGQAKRILIARAFLRDAPIVLLDEPSGGLDPASENQVMEAFDRLAEHKTVVVASHRLPVVANSDLILVLRQGRIVERGDHRALMRQGGIYHELWSRQVRARQEN